MALQHVRVNRDPAGSERSSEGSRFSGVHRISRKCAVEHRQSPYPQPYPQQVVAKPTKFGALAWTALILGIVGVVGSPIIIFNNLTAVVAGVGFVLGFIALFGTKRIVAVIGVVLCVLGIVFTVMA